MDSRPTAPWPPFEPTPDGLRTWLNALPPNTRENLAAFLVTPAARSVAAAILDQAVADQVTVATYDQVAADHGWTKANVSRRLTRHRKRAAMETVEPMPEPHQAATMATSATQTPTTGPNPSERQRQPAFLAP